MIAKQDVFISKAGETYYEITANEHERQLAEGREDVLRRERARKRREDRLLNDLAQSRQDLAQSRQDLAQSQQDLAQGRQELADRDRRIKSLEAQIELLTGKSQ